MTRDWRRMIGVSGRLPQVWFEQRLPDLRNYGSLEGCYRFGLYRGFLTSRRDQELWVSGRLLQVWVVQRLPDLQDGCYGFGFFLLGFLLVPSLSYS